MQVAALYVDTRFGPYPMLDVDCWGGSLRMPVSTTGLTQSSPILPAHGGEASNGTHRRGSPIAGHVP